MTLDVPYHLCYTLCTYNIAPLVLCEQDILWDCIGSLYNMKHIQQLHLARNRIQALDDLCESCPLLVVLDVQWNVIGSTAGWIGEGESMAIGVSVSGFGFGYAWLCSCCGHDLKGLWPAGVIILPFPAHQSTFN